jgi:hypothetical protein
VKSACNTADGRGLTSAAGGNTQCCTDADKPAYATFSTSGVYNKYSKNCKYNCNFKGTGTQCISCLSGYKWDGSKCILGIYFRQYSDGLYCVNYHWGGTFSMGWNNSGKLPAQNSCNKLAASRGHRYWFMNTNHYFRRWGVHYCYTCYSNGWRRERGFTLYKVFHH